VTFCLASHEYKDESGTCTRKDDHPAHCCDEVNEFAWNAHSKKPITCPQGYDHSEEKGLSR
jgi:hypothetical protein